MNFDVKKNFLQICKEKNLVQAEVCRKAGMTPQQLNYFLNSKNITVNNLEKVFNAVGYKVIISLE